MRFNVMDDEGMNWTPSLQESADLAAWDLDAVQSLMASEDIENDEEAQAIFGFLKGTTGFPDIGMAA